MRQYNKHYAKQAHTNSILYPGVYELLHYLDGIEIALGVCTNKDEASARQALEKMSILKFFTCVTGGDTTPYAKPHSMPLLHTLKMMNVAPEQSLLIGDTHVDALCAQQSKIGFIHYQNGYGKSVSENYACLGYFSDYAALLK
jgi:phosphoglycolate phosphatase